MTGDRDSGIRALALETLVAVTEAVHLASDEEDLARSVNDALLAGGQVDSAVCYRLLPDGQELELLDDEGLPPGMTAPRRVPLAGSVNGLSVTSAELVHVFDVRNDPRIHPLARDILNDLGVGSLVALPVRYRKTVLGSISLMWRDIRELAPFEREAFATVGRTVGLAVHNLRHTVELRQALADAERGHEQLRLILETVPLRLFWKDSQCRYTGCNLLFAHDTGLASVSEVIGKTDADMPWKGQAAKLRAIDMGVMKSGQPRIKYELDLERVDGSVHRERVSKVPVRDRDGEIVGVLGCYEDVTERISRDLKL